MDNNHCWHKLPESVKQDILDKHRDLNIDHGWWDSVYELFTEDMKAIGIRVDKMYFSGFWSQGDGACFEGCVRDWGLFLKSLGYDDPLFIKHFSQHAEFAVRHRGHYCHENCTSFSAEFRLPEEYLDEEDFLQVYGYGEELRDAALIAALSLPENSGDALEAQFTEAFKDHMRDLYHRLEEEYEYLTSDEVVLESLEANDMLDELIAEHTEELEHEE